MRALVTGSAGFIGSHLVRRLRSRGDAVLGIDRRPGDRRLDLAAPGTAGGLTELASSVDVVFHVAGRPGVRDTDPAIEWHRWRDNVEATRRLFQATPLGVPVVVTSSSSVYGGSDRTGDGVRPCHESDPLHPRGGYARSKVAMETLCEQRRRRGGVVTVVRPFTVAGEGQRPDMAFAQWVVAIRRGDPVRLLGSASRSRDVTDVLDVVEGLVRSAEAGYQGTINLGTGVGHRIIDMAETVLAALGTPAEIVVQSASPEEVSDTLADTRRCGDVLGFVPSTDLEAVVERFIASPRLAVPGVAAR